MLFLIHAISAIYQSPKVSRFNSVLIVHMVVCVQVECRDRISPEGKTILARLSSLDY
jgi:hypothetical protein